MTSATSTADKAGSGAGARDRIGTFTALRGRDFRLLLIGTTLSNAAQWIQQVTLSWLVYELTGSGAALGTVNLLRSVTALGLAPVAGVAIDRFSRRRLMLMTQAWLFTITVGMGLLLASGRATDQAGVPALFVFAALGGAGQAFDMPLRQTATFDLVPRALAPNAVALIQTGWSLMRSLGPAVGGLLILWFGPAGNFFVQATAYALIAVTVLQIRFPPRQGGDGRPVGVLRNLRGGIAYVVRSRTTRTFVMMGWVLPLLIIPVFSALPPIYAKDVFAGGPATLGFLMSAVGVGGIAGGVFTASLGHFERRGLVQLGALLGTSLALMAFALSPGLGMALPLLAVAGAFEMVYLTTNQTLLQLSIPDEMRGRVTSIVNLNAALSPVGAFLAGVGSDLFGPRATTIALSGAAALIALLVFARSTTVREYRLSQAMPVPAG
jgi:MFS transporter, DHA1 family, staphyloferrin A biosynthesis exporter